MKGVKKITHHTLSLPLVPMPPEAPAARGAGGISVFVGELDVEDVLGVCPSALALEGSRLRDMDGL